VTTAAAAVVPYNFEKYSPSYDWLTTTPKNPPQPSSSSSDDLGSYTDSPPLAAAAAAGGLTGFSGLSGITAGFNSRPPSPRGGTTAAAVNYPVQPSVPPVTENILTQTRNKLPHATRIKPVKTDIVTGGVIPKYGFVLRTVLGFSAQGCGSVCSRCPWLSGCHGCLYPDDPDLLVESSVADEEVLAVDWHYVVYQEFLDEKLVSEIKKHVSVEKEEDLAKNNIIPFSKCLAKFTEEETIEGP
jgi:hypothetical protein